jgi:hypothetical protein
MLSATERETAQDKPVRQQYEITQSTLTYTYHNTITDDWLHVAQIGDYFGNVRLRRHAGSKLRYAVSFLSLRSDVASQLYIYPTCINRPHNIIVSIVENNYLNATTKLCDQLVVVWSAQRIVPVGSLGSLDRSRYYFFHPHEAEWTPFQTRCFSENLEAPGIKPRTSGSVARNSDHYTTEAYNYNDKIKYFIKTTLHVSTMSTQGTLHNRRINLRYQRFTYLYIHIQDKVLLLWLTCWWKLRQSYNLPMHL